MDHNFVELIDQYDPEREIVVVFQLRGFGNSIGRYENPAETPAAIYRRKFN